MGGGERERAAFLCAPECLCLSGWGGRERGEGGAGLWARERERELHFFVRQSVCVCACVDGWEGGWARVREKKRESCISLCPRVFVHVLVWMGGGTGEGRGVVSEREREKRVDKCVYLSASVPVCMSVCPPVSPSVSLCPRLCSPQAWNYPFLPPIHATPSSLSFKLTHSSLDPTYLPPSLFRQGNPELATLSTSTRSRCPAWPAR